MTSRSSTRPRGRPGARRLAGSVASGARQQPAGRVRRRQRQARAGLVHQPGQWRPGRRRRGVLDRRLHDHHPGPPPGRQPAAHPAGPPARGQGPQDRPDVARPALHRGVRRRRLPGRGARRTPRPAARGAGHLPGRAGRGDLEGQAGRLPVLVQHPGALVSQVLRREDRPGHVAAGHLGPDHQGRVEPTAARSPCRPTSTRATSCGSTPSSRVPAARSWPTPRRASTPTSRSPTPPARRRPPWSRSWPPPRRRRRT